MRPDANAEAEASFSDLVMCLKHKSRAGNESSQTCLSSTRLDKNWFSSKLGSSLKRTFNLTRVRLV